MVLPVAAPVTTPAPVIVATVVFELDHVPPGTASLSTRNVPEQMVTLPPAMGAGTAVTVTITVDVQPVAEEVKVMIELVGATPVTRPPPGVMVATVVVPLVHVPAAVLLSCVVEPAQTLVIPVMGGAGGLTVTLTVEVHPVPDCT